MNNQICEKVKIIELEILKYVDEICRINNLKYYMIGGTLLGAVRHNGFIPWDDDIDIGLIREDYNTLIQILAERNDDRFFIQNFRTDPMYPKYITKIRFNGTKFIEKQVMDIDMHQGIFIDIFPLDRTKKKFKLTMDFRVHVAKIILIARQLRNGQIKTTRKHKKLIAHFTEVLTEKIPLAVYDNLLDFIYCIENNKNCEYITNFSSQYGWRKQTFPIDVYGEGTYLEFEGHQFMAPAKWEVILKSLYGDYMKLPPEEKRNSGHDVVHIDIGKYAEN